MEKDDSFTSLLNDSSSDGAEVLEDCSEDYLFTLKISFTILTDYVDAHNALDNLVEKFEAEYFQQTLQSCLSAYPVNLLDEKVFSEILPVAHRYLIEVMNRISNIISTSVERDTLENVKRQLFVCHELLNVWEKSVDRVSKLHKTSAVSLKSLSENIPITIKLVFEHCRGSAKFYNTLFEGVSEKLTNLFRKAKTILSLFLATLESVIVFDTDTELEIELLVKVIDGIGSLATIAHELDLKTFVETSKMFGKLSIMHQHNIIRVKSICVTLHFDEMIKNVSWMISLLQESRDRSVDEKKIRVIGHSLKILDRLFIAYSSCINAETLSSVVELLLQMYRCSPSCLQKSQIDDKTVELINVHISKGTEPFLDTVFQIFAFKQAFFEYGDNCANVDKLGYHLLTVSILRKLISTPFEQHCIWTLGAESIIDVALTNINYIQEEICTGEIRLPGAHDVGEKPREATLYEATLVPICALISDTPPDGFCAVELILLKHLLSRRLWSSLLSSDIWCFISRIGSSELCVSHVKYLLKVYTALMKRHNDLETVILENLIGRLYSLLSEETKHTLVTELDDLENPSWIILARFFPSKTKTFLQNRLACVLNEVPGTFAELQQQPTLKNWNQITTMMSVIGKLNYAGEKTTVDILSQIWSSIADTIEIFEGRQLDILSEFLGKLFSATQPEKIQDDTFFTILEAVLTSLLCSPSHVRAIATHYLRNNVDSFDACGLKTANALAELNCRLLEDENPWVRQEAYESFDQVAHACPNEELVTKMVAAVTRRPVLSDSIPAYLSGAPYYELSDFPDVRFYLQHAIQGAQNVCHVCYHYEESQREEKLARLETQPSENSIESSGSNDLNEHVSKVCDELNDIARKTSDIDDRTLRRLRLICTKILNLSESSK
ncbi:FIGNL1-interacting regulator of recombination and mitosis [Colletes latitarsis]|uniref:FIGNL1-interacting regulator of recombination and mitosis n=1 Tax=Colletes latitarsis TaxID=2605962 RepID=UPI0040373DD1